MASDISEKQQYSDADLALLASIMDSSDAIVAETLDGEITRWNHAAEKVYG